MRRILLRIGLSQLKATDSCCSVPNRARQQGDCALLSRGIMPEMSASRVSNPRTSRFTVVCMLLLGAVSTGSLAWNESDPVPAVAASVVARLQQISHAVVSAANCAGAQEVAGRYTTETHELKEIMGGGGDLFGDSLFLFRDGTYIYAEWTDVFPESVVDSGRWSLAADLLELNSDNGGHLEKRGLRDSRFVVFCLSRQRRRELRIVGATDEIGRLEKRFRDSPTPAPAPAVPADAVQSRAPAGIPHARNLQNCKE